MSLASRLMVIGDPTTPIASSMAGIGAICGVVVVVEVVVLVEGGIVVDDVVVVVVVAWSRWWGTRRQDDRDVDGGEVADFTALVECIMEDSGAFGDAGEDNRAVAGQASPSQQRRRLRNHRPRP